MKKCLLLQNKKLLALIFSIPLLNFANSIFAQEALKSTEEEYYDFLSLQGIVNRPTLGYRTLSDSVWTISDENSCAKENIWAANNLGKIYTLWENKTPADNWFANGISQSVKYKIYGPEWFNSYNTAAPYGQNDGALWQGRGYNTFLTAGARLEAYGFEITFKPQISFSQNMEFEFISPNEEYNSPPYAFKGDTFGYYGIYYIDYPQRFGNSPFFTFDWGDSEIRYTWKKFTLGFGTQAIWTGPSQINSIIHSNNAASYPKVDFGFRKTSLYIPSWNLDLGDIEFRVWYGKLSESEYFDNDETNDKNLISGLSFCYSFPGIFKGFSIGFNRSMLSKFNNISPYTTLEFLIPVPFTEAGEDESDQRASFTFSYLFNNGLNIYFEWARNDFSRNFDAYIKYPFHTQAYTFGIRKSYSLTSNLYMELLFETTNLVCSQDYENIITWNSTFYAHHIVTQGYTNKGQLIGAGCGTGSNSQFLKAKFYHKKGSFSFYMQRLNPDLDYTWFIDSKKIRTKDESKAENNIRASFIFGLDNCYILNRNLYLTNAIILIDEHNPLNISSKYTTSDHRINLALQAGIKWSI